MAVAVKVCGLSDRTAVDCALAGGATFLGLVFYPPSPRAVTPGQAAALVSDRPRDVATVGVFVDPDDDLLAGVLRAVPLDFLQLHGDEPPERVRAVRALTGRGVIKALSVRERADLGRAAAYDGVADMLLFDAKPSALPGQLPGGNGVPFDWRLLRHLEVRSPWLLSGGLDIDNLATAIATCGAKTVDVSSGVERAPGVKDPGRIRAFLDLAASLEPEALPDREPDRAIP